METASIILNFWLLFLRLQIQRNTRSADGAQVTKSVTNPIIPSGERPIEKRWNWWGEWSLDEWHHYEIRSMEVEHFSLKALAGGGSLYRRQQLINGVKIGTSRKWKSSRLGPVSLVLHRYSSVLAPSRVDELPTEQKQSTYLGTVQ